MAISVEAARKNLLRLIEQGIAPFFVDIFRGYCVHRIDAMSFYDVETDSDVIDLRVRLTRSEYTKIQHWL